LTTDHATPSFATGALLSSDSHTLAAYVRTHPTFRMLDRVEDPYKHMGATLTDGVLQRGMRYRTHVRPKVDALRAAYPDATTISVFAGVLVRDSPPIVVHWRGQEKLDTLAALIALLQRDGVESEDDFRTWIQQPGHLARLRTIKGIKDKTAHYFEILLGLESTAVDTHLFAFLAEAGVATSDYARARATIVDAAALLQVSLRIFDHSMWKYMSERDARNKQQKPARTRTRRANALCPLP